MLKQKWGTLLATAAIAGLSACGSSSSDGGSSSDSDITIAGTLAVSSFKTMSMGDGFKPSDVELSDYKMSCVTFAVPPTAASGSISSDGSFSVTLADALDAKFGCFIVDSDDAVIATMVFEDQDSTDMSGNTQQDTSTSLGGNAKLGTITLDLASGKATVDTSSIEVTKKEGAKTDTEKASGEGYWNITGTWKFASMGKDLPDGYSDVCPAETGGGGGGGGGGGDDCNGPRANETVFFKQVDGKRYKNGAATDKPAHGMMIWSSKDAFEACGSTLGTTVADLQANGVDFTEAVTAQVNEGDFTWASHLVGSDTLVDGWKSSSATTNFNMQVGCDNYSYQNDMGWRCHDTVNNTYELGFGGGCYNVSTNEPVRIDDWSSISWGSNTSVTPKHTGFSANEQAGTYNGDAIKCRFESGRSTSATFATINNALTFDHSNVATIAQGTLCSHSSFNSHPLDRLKCYADYYFQHQHDADGCLPDIRTNYSATDADHFVNVSHQTKDMYAGNFYDIDVNGVGSFHDEHEDYRGVQAGSSNWVNCRVREGFTITVTPKNKKGETATQAIVEFASESALLDVDNKACVAWFVDEMGATKKSLGNGVNVYVTRMKTMSKMSKQN